MFYVTDQKVTAVRQQTQLNQNQSCTFIYRQSDQKIKILIISQRLIIDLSQVQSLVLESQTNISEGLLFVLETELKLRTQKVMK